jgi:uncharacterized integral membrane protein
LKKITAAVVRPKATSRAAPLFLSELGTLVRRCSWFSSARRTTQMISISPHGRPITSAWLPAIILVLFILLFFPDDLAAQGQPVETASHLPVALWFIGAGVLGLVMAYGIMRNRTRTRAEKQSTEQATKNLYTKENRDRAASG